MAEGYDTGLGVETARQGAEDGAEQRKYVQDCSAG
jgi:hypothetical protein